MLRLATLALCCALALAGAPSSAAEGEAKPPPSPEAKAPAPEAKAPAAEAKPAEPVQADRDAAARSLEEDLRRSEPEGEESFTVRSVLWMFAAMAFVIAAIYITLNYGLRRLMGVRAVGSVSLVQVLERVALDQKKSLYVLRAAGEYLLVGAADAGLSLICKLDTQEVERLERESRVQAQGMSPFLQKLLSRKGGSPPPSA